MKAIVTQLPTEVQAAICRVISDGEIAEVKLESGKPVVVRISRKVVVKDSNKGFCGE